MVPLQQALRVGEGAVLFGVSGGRKEEDLRGNIFRPHLAAIDLRRFFQNSAVSMSWKSRTTSHSSLRIASRWKPPFIDPTTGFSPMMK